VSQSAVALVGPTASGKTTIALEIASDLGAEIVCVDSMTVYRGMDIGTAKPTAQDQARVRHHLLDIADPREPFTLAMFQDAARRAVAGIDDRGATPFYVGGSGLYFRAAVDDLSLPPTDAAVRARLSAEDPTMLARRLAELDPQAASFIDPGNARRVVRALEVIELTGKPFSSFRDAWDRYTGIAVAGLQVPRYELATRVGARAQAMLDAGLLDEVRALIAAGYREALTASKAIGYAAAIQILDGDLDASGFVQVTVRDTMRLARRQVSWFKADPRVRWIDATDVHNAIAEVRAYYLQHVEAHR
jgi:tRNA dimethylallyltransferase